MEEQEKQVEGGVKSHCAGGGLAREQRFVEKRGRGAGRSIKNLKIQSLKLFFKSSHAHRNCV